MKKGGILFFAILLAVVSATFYIFHFFGESLSNNSSDWGAFGNYMGIGVGLVSMALIYITYDEQRSSNKIARFEQRFVTMTNTLAELAVKNTEELESNYQIFCKHFLHNTGISGYEREKIVKVLIYYFSDVTTDFDNIFRYLAMSIAFIRNANFLSDEEKKGRITELACIVPESIRIFYMCWQLSKGSKSLKKDCESGLFVLDGDEPKLLNNIIAFLCIGKKPFKNEYDDVSELKITLEDYSDELFCDTYCRLNKIK